MLQPVISVLRKRGIPFHNPYRKSNGLWNPLRQNRKGSSTNRILALLVAHPDYSEQHREWTYGDIRLWAECLHSRGVLRPGARARLDASEDLALVTLARLDELLEPAAMKSLLETFEGDYRQLLTWWRQRLNATFHPRVQFPLEIAMAGGPRTLVETPKVTVGTIHSVKGGEADVVFLFPDLSQAGDAAYQRSGLSRDAVIRQFYVGLTRARHMVYVCQPESAMAVRI
jgi:superfamily I DNA/RNA helicase